MYTTSDRYKEVVRDTSAQYLMGLITLSNGDTINIDDTVVSSGSVSITRQSITGQELSFGGAIMGELDISIRTDISRYLMYDAEIDLWCRVVVDGSPEYIPMGIYLVAEAERDKKALKMVAYDTLIKFNKKYDLALEGTPYMLMNAFATSCGCELAEDEEYYNNLTNGDQYITINQDAGCANFRDAASIVAQMCGCFVQSDRYGRISMRQFSTVPSFAITKGQRYSSTISDFECHYIEVEIVGQSGTFVSVNEEFDVGMKMLIEDAPAWDYGLEEILQQKTDNLRLLLEQIYYTPCELSIPSDPAIDCGDMVMLFMDDGNTDAVNSIITSYTWNYRGAMELTSSGVNPYLQTTDAASSRQLRNLKQEIDAAKVIYYPFANAGRFKLGATAQKVASVVFTTVDDTSVVFQGTVQVDVEVPDIEEENIITFPVPTIESSEEVIIDAATGKKTTNYTFGEQILEFPIKTYKRDFANLRIYYSYDNVQQRVEYINALNDGGHTISLFYPVNKIDSNTTHTFEIWMSIENGDATVREGMFIGAVSGQGLAATSQWNGQLELEDYIEIVYRERNHMDVRPLVDVGAVLEPNTKRKDSMFNTHFSRIAFNPAVGIRTLTEVIGDNHVDLIVKQQTVTFNTKDNKYIEVADGTTHFRTLYVFEGETIEIDEGNAVSAHVRTDDLKTVEMVVTE